MIRLLIYKLIKYAFLTLLCSILLLSAAWNLPQTQDYVIQLENHIEEKYNLDISEKMLILEQAWEKFRRIDRSYVEMEGENELE